VAASAAEVIIITSMAARTREWSAADPARCPAAYRHPAAPDRSPDPIVNHLLGLTQRRRRAAAAEAGTRATYRRFSSATMASSSTINTFITHVSFYYPREMNKKLGKYAGFGLDGQRPPSSRSCWLARNSPTPRFSPLVEKPLLKIASINASGIPGPSSLTSPLSQPF
jgi:hypothetical protein